MRWHCFDRNTRAEALERQAVIQRVDAWWDAFTAKKEDISAHFSQTKPWDLAEWMEQNLQAIDERIMWEFGPALKGHGHRLVMTPEAQHQLRPLVRTILARAPEMEGWEFYEYRLPEALATAQGWVVARTGVDITDFKVRATKGSLNRINLVYTSPSFPSDEDSAALNAAFVATEGLLGEECLDHWIGAIEFVPTPKPGALGKLFGRKSSELASVLPLDRLREMVNALIESTREQLPPEPHYVWAEEALWSVGEAKPEESEDYYGRDDILTLSTLNVDLLNTTMGGGLFSSKRFSRCGETFCYLKIDGKEGLPDGDFDDRGDIEDALNEMLVAGQLGCHIGGAMGLRYVYIDLALTDLPRAIAAIKQRLREGNVPSRSWILFHDNDLAAEWVGIYDDTPPPPMNFEG